MKFGLGEIILIFLIALILFGPTVIPRVQRWLRRCRVHAVQQQRLRARREAEARRRRDAQLRYIQQVVLGVFGTALVAGAAYLLLRPAPVQPQRYQSVSAGFTGAYAKNSVLDEAEPLPLGSETAPVCVRWREGWLYAAVSGGRIVRVHEDGTGLSLVLQTDGEITGFDFLPDGRLVLACIGGAAGGQSGLLLAAPDAWNGQLAAQTLLTEAGGRALVFPTAVCAAADGTVYFAEGCAVPAGEYGVKNAYVLALLAHGADGAVYACDPDAGTAEPVLTGLTFAAGLAAEPAGGGLYVSDAGTGTVWRVAASARAVEAGCRGSQAVLQGLPGRPAGLAAGDDGRLWVALSGPRGGWLDALGGVPRLRGAVMNLPAMTRSRLVLGGRTAVLAFDAAGNILENWQSARLGAVTGVCESDTGVYLAHGTGGVLDRRRY